MIFHWIKYNRNKRFHRGSNPGPSACEADVITTTPRNLDFHMEYFIAEFVFLIPIRDTITLCTISKDVLDQASSTMDKSTSHNGNPNNANVHQSQCSIPLSHSTSYTARILISTLDHVQPVLNLDLDTELWFRWCELCKCHACHATCWWCCGIKLEETNHSIGLTKDHISTVSLL